MSSLSDKNGEISYPEEFTLAPKETGVQDYIGGFVVTAGIGIESYIEQFEKDHDDYNSIMLKALADRLAEAFAEKLHQSIRKEYWGYNTDEDRFPATVKEEVMRLPFSQFLFCCFISVFS